MWMMPLHLHLNQKSDYDYDDVSNGLGGDAFTRNVTDGHPDGRRTDFGMKLIYPFFLKKTAGIITRNVSQCDKCPQRQDISRTDARGQNHSDPKTVCDTPQPQDVFTHTKFGIPTSNNIGDMLQS